MKVGHLIPGCIACITAEGVSALLAGRKFRREPDTASGDREPALQPKPR